METLYGITVLNMKPEDQWSCKRSPDYFPGITTTVKREKGGNIDFLDAQEQLTVVHD